jgi:hypothetical protein
MSKPERYCDIEKIINDKTYALDKEISVKEKNGLYVLKYNKSALNDTNFETLGWFRSVISDGKKVLSVAPPKSVMINLIKNNYGLDECYAEEFVEGTMINCFYNEGEWNIATRSTIGGDCKFDSVKTFREMFFEAMEEIGLSFKNLKKEYSYSFVLQHPDNRIVVPFKTPNLILVEIFNISNFTFKDKCNEEFKDLIKIVKIPNKITFNSWDELFETYSDTEFKVVGCIVKTNDNLYRTKIRNKNYEYIRRLKGNSTKLQYQYYSLRKLKKIKEFLTFYPEFTKDFNHFKDVLYKWTEELYKNYRLCFINKEKSLKEYPFNFRINMYNLHQIYLKDLRPNKKWVHKNIVKNYINNLDAGSLMYIINFKDKSYNNKLI